MSAIRSLTDSEIEQVFGGTCTGQFTCVEVQVCVPSPNGGPSVCTTQEHCTAVPGLGQCS